MRNAMVLFAALAAGSVGAAEKPYRQLFFDDQRLFVRENLDRVYGEAKFEELYQDEALVSVAGCVRGLLTEGDEI